MGIDSKKKKVFIMILINITLQEADAALERMINEKVAEKRGQAVSQVPKNVEQLHLIVNKQIYEKDYERSYPPVSYILNRRFFFNRSLFSQYGITISL